jgi:hypothetical protein
VVLGADSAAAIRRTHARYFKTVPELLRELADLLPGDADLLPDG